MFVERAENLVLLGLPGAGKTDIGMCTTLPRDAGLHLDSLHYGR